MANKVEIYRTAGLSCSLLCQEMDNSKETEVICLISNMYNLNWFSKLCLKKRAFVVIMVYLVGASKFFNCFKNTVSSLENGDFEKAVGFLVDSTILETVDSNIFEEALKLVGRSTIGGENFVE